MSSFNFFSGSPQDQALLAVASGLLEAGGPSRAPVSLGQGAARAMMLGRETYDSALRNQSADAFRKAQMSLMEQQARKAQFDADLTSQAMAGGQMGATADPDRLEALGARLAMGGHPGGATLITQAQKLRDMQRNRQVVEGMRSTPGMLGAVVPTTSPQGQQLMSVLTGDPSFDSAVLKATNEALNSAPGVTPQPLQAPRQGLFSPLMASPYVGPYAEQLQAQLNNPSSTGLNPEDWIRHFERLQQQDLTATNQATARRESADLRRDIADQQASERRFLAGMARGDRQDRQRGIEDQRTFSKEQTLSDDYNRLSQDFRVVLPNFKSTAEYVANGKYDSSGDRALVFSYARILDPRDRVSVRDITDIQKLGNVPERVMQAVQALAEGKKLPDRVRNEMFSVMRSRFENMNDLQRQLEDEYSTRARRYMLKPENVVIRHSIGGWSATPVK